MSSVRAKNTKPELEIRRRLFSMGFRYCLYRKDLPGKPDIVFPKYRSAVFIHGCFWHHHGCHLSSIPKTRYDWWKEKLEGNALRDSRVTSLMQNLGWRILIIWECEFRRPKTNRSEALDGIAARASDFIMSDQKFLEIPQYPYT